VRIPPQVLHLVEVEAPADKAPEGEIAVAQDESVDAPRRAGAQRTEGLLQLRRVEVACTDLLVTTWEPVRLKFLEGM